LASGLIFDIMHYSIHDGPGIRTTVFFKGCPLRCWWCHNPESQSMKKEIIFRENRCAHCGDCVKACPHGLKNISQCDLCGNCVNVCHSGAREMVGRLVKPEEVMQEIKKDIIFYDESGGGATFSGGEPLMQPEFLYSLLEKCREEEIHTTLETCGFAAWNTLKKISTKVDLFLFDLKLMDEENHKKYTGVSNKIILDNLKHLAQDQHQIIVRVPVIPGINDSTANIRAIGTFAVENNIREIHLLPYHKAGVDKYAMSQRTYQLPDIEPPEARKMEEIYNMINKLGLKTKIGG